MTNNLFVFVVCGSKEHIDTLHFSLEYLKKNSQNTILVLTDSTRNEIPISHEHVIDVQAPTEFNHHQASIYLKTGIHKFVPKGHNYCYIDSDVIAFSPEVDAIFDEFIEPIRFAPDHCRLNYFSPYAVNCNCQQLFNTARDRFLTELNHVDPLRLSADSRVINARKTLELHYQRIKKNKLRVLWTALRYVLSFRQFRLTDDIYFDKKKRTWITNEGVVFMNDFSIRKIARKAELRWRLFSNEPTLANGVSIWKDQCEHLGDYIYNKFGIQVSDNDFQHWNGGVFLFNDSSHEFLNCWFDLTMEIFKDPTWKTRDQGTLIATVWKFGLENQPTLDKRWNLIADYYNPHLAWRDEYSVKLSEKEVVIPVFIHVYHHFQDENWLFWQQLVR